MKNTSVNSANGIVTTNDVATMSSLELVEVINSLREEGKAELLHKNFMVKIENHPGITSAKFLAYVEIDIGNGAKRKSKCYHLPKRECELMVMSESLAVQAKVYDRMTELANQVMIAFTKPKAKTVGTIEANKIFRSCFSIARLIGLDKNAAALSANQATFKLTDENVLSLLGQTHLAADDQVALCFTPTELGKRINVSGQKFNQLLMEAGLQEKQGDTWVPTEAGKVFCRLLDTSKRHNDGTIVTQMKWADNVLSLIQSAA
jgi:hypothetical protein